MGIEELIERGVAFADAMQYEDARSDFEAALLLDPGRFEVLSNLGTLSQLANQHQAAIEQYTLALELYPHHSPSLYSRGLSYASLGKFQHAVDDYSHALRLDPTFVRALMGRGHILMQQGKWSAALTDFDLFLTHSASEHIQLVRQVEDWREAVLKVLEPPIGQVSNFEQIQVEAETAIQTGDLATAMTLAEQGLKLAPNSSSAYNLYSCVMVAYENWPQAKSFIDKAIELDEQAPVLYLNRAAITHAMNLLEVSEQDIRQAIALEPDHAEAHLELGSLLAPTRTEEAMNAFSRALDLASELVDARLGRARLYLLEHQPELALLDLTEVQRCAPQHPDAYDLIQQVMETYETQITAAPFDPMSYVRRAQAYLQLGREEDALADWNYALKLDSENPLLLDGRAMLLIEIEQYSQAIIDLERAMDIAPEVADLYHHRALALIHLRRTSEAIEDLGRAITYSPEKADAYYLRGKLSRTQEHMDEAFSDLHLAIELGGQQADLFKEYALVLLEKGEWESAAEAYQQAASIHPDPDICLDCAYTLNALGRIEEAINYLDLLLRDWPDHVEALSERGWLLAQVGKLEEAIEDLTYSVEVAPHQWEGWLYLTEIHIALEQWEEAVITASRCLLGNTDSERAYYLRGLAFRHLKNVHASDRDWDRVLLSSPASEEATLIAEAR
ncbi:MAG: tetratricopeptide repeat protein [Bacteroidota bacterium]